MGKIIFLDVDGTLVDYENRIPASAVNAVRAARRNGHSLYISTGRSKSEVYQEIWDIGWDGMIGGNGSYVEDNGHVVSHQCLSGEQCMQIVDWLRGRGLEYYLESNEGLFGSSGFEERGKRVIREYAKRKGESGADTLTVRDMYPSMIFNTGLYRDDLNKISFILESYEDFQEAQNRFPDLQAGVWGGRGEEALFGDFGLKNINKALAIEKLLCYLGRDVRDTVAFGDAKVDIPMLKYCAFGVAMGNGGPEIKAAADYITGDVDKDGIQDAFRYLGLI